MGKSGEPSVEEILESIKNVMERDSRASAADAKRRKRTEAQEAEPEKPEPSQANEEEVLDLAELDLAEVVELADDESQPLIGEETRGAMQENLAALAMLAQPGAKPQIVRSGETSLEGLTRELMRPMLAEWLDKNLPGMVEKMVQAEIARIAGKRD
ncbi:DUF2497 domain-containing protein [Erythrobacter sp. SCSIO 43205]|uniref:DUF2497 domain-containing protein n=1 Tax=Erythrobacter sp. SCSIO 43205 TaxID=2779361 RepID=UPI001CA7F0F9|nr:DUF2497 domain-containing protein [Erythrobacter sp. SCSIO 43205]UAB78456.1 DUF2497 domain-containing protein [Erythrobacter sp. SCSIO 43205]